MDKRVAIEVGTSCLALHSRRAARRISRIYDDALRPIGLNNGQFSLMTMLLALDGATLGELADRLGLDRTTLNATLKPLERDGLVRSEQGDGDRRVRRLSVTGEGRRRLGDAEPLWRAAQAATEAKLDRSSDLLRTDLRKLG